MRWSPPLLTGLAAAKPFPLIAGYAPYLKSTATAQVEVLPAAEPAALRVVPADGHAGPGADRFAGRRAAAARLGAVEGSPPRRGELDGAGRGDLGAGQPSRCGRP